jgi:GTP-binding protein
VSRTPVVAVVGRPNVGKSSLVNRILGRRVAVVDERPGVTRDRREFVADWAGHDFLIVDTGGWEVSPQEELVAAISAQAEAALGSADVVLFVVDATAGVSEDDARVARLLREAPVLLVANKVDGVGQEPDVPDLWQLGLGEPIPVSALHGRGVGDLLDKIVARLPEAFEATSEELRKLAIIGRPNVGKSTLLNRLVREDRVLVSPVPGTTRDPIDVVATIGETRYRVVDTAGIRRAPKVKDSADYYSVLRARGALAEADVALLLVDGADQIVQQDQRIAEAVVESGAGLIVLVNKWDVPSRDDRETITVDVTDRLGFVGWAPMLRVSALTGRGLHRLGPALDEVFESRTTRVSTGVLNRLVREWQEAHPAPTRKGRRPRILYAVQAGIEPPTFVLFVGGGELDQSYLRYLERKLREEFPFIGTPVRLVARRRKPPPR